MSCSRFEENNREALRGLNPILRGTWTSDYPEFYYRGSGNGGSGESGENDSNGGIPRPEQIVRSGPQVTLSSSAGGTGPLPVIAASLGDPIHVVSATVNTSRAGNVNNLIQFTGIIHLPKELALILNFQIIRSNSAGSAVKIGPTFTYSEALSSVGAKAFSFQFADNNVTPGTYTYSVQLGTGTLVASAGVTITNAVLSILGVSDRG